MTWTPSCESCAVVVDVNRQAELVQRVDDLRDAARVAESRNQWGAAWDLRSRAADAERELGRVSR